MTITIRYLSSDGMPGKRYVKRHPVLVDTYDWCVQNADQPQYNHSAGTCNGADLPDDIKARCDAAAPSVWYTCEWPKG